MEGDGGGGGLPSSLNWSDSFGGSGTLASLGTVNNDYYDSANNVDLFYDSQFSEWVFNGYSEFLSDPTGLAPQGTYSGGAVIS